jgi:hypothetical protein
MKYQYTFLTIVIIVLIVVVVSLNVFLKTFTEGFEKAVNSPNNGSMPLLSVASLWPPDLIKRFITFQNTMNLNNVQYNLDILQQQASPEEAEYLLKNRIWPWPEDLKQKYLAKVRMNKIIKVDPESALNYAMRIYNAAAVNELLFLNTKEGQFLIYGLTMPNKSKPDYPYLPDTTIKCNNGKIEKTEVKGYNRWNGYMNKKTTILTKDDLPNTAFWQKAYDTCANSIF